MCAGCSAEERERAESDVRRALGARAAGGETWIVSVINLQSRWSVTLDGPGIRALNCTASPGRLVEAIQEALQARTGAPPPAAAAPVSPMAAAPRSVAPAAAAATPASRAAPAPRPVATMAGPQPGAPLAGRAPAAAAPAPPRSAPRPTPVNTAPAPSAISPASGPRHDRHECVQCHQRFGVIFEAVAGEPEQLTPVACPHCWHMNHVLVGETAADTSDYRAERA